MKHICKAVVPALVVAFVAGCGSDVPTTKDMSDKERQEQTDKQKEYQMKQQQQGPGKTYEDAAKKRSG